MATTSSDVLVQAIMTTKSGLVEDRIVNNWAFRHSFPFPDEEALTNVANVVGNFYTTGAAAVNKVGNYISQNVDRAATHELAVYQISAGPLGSPLLTIPWLGPPAPTVTDSLPDEVAGVLSFHGNLTGVPEEGAGTRPRARRRGRVYIGPLSLQAIDYDVEPVFLSTNFRVALQANAVAMADQADFYDWSWSVWSREANELYRVVGGWTDNACDTQRRRGPNSTSRTTFGPI